MKRILMAMAAAAMICACSTNKETNKEYDVIVIGGGSSGISAGISSARNGAKTLIVEEGPWLGGMLTSAGVSGVDGNYLMRGGFFREFCDSVAARYGGYDNLHSAWVANVIFEPKIGADIFLNIAQNQKGLDLRLNSSFISAEKLNRGWAIRIQDSEGKEYKLRTKILIDGTELGDVAKACGVSYHIGMDSREFTGESIAPEKANNIVQDLTYTVILKDFGQNADMTIPRPESYDSTLFRNACEWRLNAPELTNRVIWPAEYMIRYARIPTYTQYMINWPIDGNDYYLNIIESTPEERKEELEKAKEFTRCFIYFVQTELGMKNLGIDMDQFPTDDGFPLIPYHRESRRIDGEVLFTVDYAAKPFEQKLPLYRTGIAVGDYAVDHHHARYSGYEGLPDLHFYPIPSYNVPMGALIPADTEDLIVIEKSISVSNIMNGASRVQPVTMQIGQAGGIMAAIAAKENISIHEIPVRKVQKAILDAGGYIMPYIDTHPDDEYFDVYQRIGATGMLKGDPRNVGWANQTWFMPDGDFTVKELHEIFGESASDSDIYPATFEEVEKVISKYKPFRIDEICPEIGIEYIDLDGIVTRGIFARIVDKVLNPFECPIDHYGAPETPAPWEE